MDIIEYSKYRICKNSLRLTFGIEKGIEKDGRRKEKKRGGGGRERGRKRERRRVGEEKRKNLQEFSCSDLREDELPA